MIAEADNFLWASDGLADLVEPLGEEDFAETTQFKDWTVSDVLRHLHVWNVAADLALTDETGFDQLMRKLAAASGMRRFEEEVVDGRQGRAMLRLWRDFYPEMAARFRGADPKARLQWVGPSMSVRSAITARLMESWAHGQEVFDHLGVRREETDSIRGIAQLGINTFGWTYRVRGKEVPPAMPYVRVTAPSGALWQWGEASQTDRIEGSAVDFCRTVTQVRNVEDTDLHVVGDTAKEWMATAQCFAGPAHAPPPPGTRFRKEAA